MHTPPMTRPDGQTISELNAIVERVTRVIHHEFGAPTAAQPRNDAYIAGFTAALFQRLTGYIRPIPFRADSAEREAYLDGRVYGADYQLPTGGEQVTS